jgi:histidinol-phosphate aminotransferase
LVYGQSHFYSFYQTNQKNKGLIINKKNKISRRKFLTGAATASSFIFLPGIGRIKADPLENQNPSDYLGRLCYNENPLGLSTKVQAAMTETIALSHRYPDWYSSNLEGVIADKHRLSSSNICVGAGATEVIRLIADAFLMPGDELITATPTYSQMAREATANGATTVHVPVTNEYIIDLENIFNAITPQTKMIFLVNPNNPLATIMDKNDVQNFIESLTENIIVVVDEAYFDYVSNSSFESCIRYIKQDLPVIVVRTFSKAYGLAGARIGYAIASSNFTSLISASQIFGTVSRVSQAAAETALADQEHVTATVALNDEAKAILENGFSQMGLNFIKSETNFMMFDTGTNASTVANQLYSKGYQVRTGWGMPSFIRTSTGTLEEMSGFIEALNGILVSGIQTTKTAPTSFALNYAYPNPFNSYCKINFTCQGSEKVRILIYNARGQKIQVLNDSFLQPGNHEVYWDGKNVSGQSVASGVYIINIIQGEQSIERRITLVK